MHMPGGCSSEHEQYSAERHVPQIFWRDLRDNTSHVEHFPWDTVPQADSLRGLDATDTAPNVLDRLNSPGSMEAVCGNN